MGRLTLNGMYSYDNTLFEGMILPPDYDVDALFMEIMNRCGQLYPYHQQPAILKSAIRLWFARNYLNFDRIMDALTAEYDPIENYNRHTNWTRTPDLTDTDTKSGVDSLKHTGNDKLEKTGKDEVKNSGTDNNDHTYTNYKETLDMSGSHVTEEQVSAFDQSAYQPSKKTIETFGDPTARKDEKSITGSHKDSLTHGLTETTTRGTTDTTTFNSTEATTYGSTVTGRHTGNEQYAEHTHGNIGVTTTQQMITQELELRMYDVYVDIAKRFEHEFLVQVY